MKAAPIPLLAFYELLLCGPALAGPIADPVQDFLAEERREVNDQLLKVEGDLNGDGKKEVMLSLSHMRNGKAGNIWVIYSPSEGGYTKLTDLISFREDALYVGYVEQLRAPGLVSYWPGGGGKGSLMAYQVEHARLKATKLGEIEPQGKDAGIYDRFFGKIRSASSPQTLAVVAPSMQRSLWRDWLAIGTLGVAGIVALLIALRVIKKRLRPQ